jgi:hypothetical protein
MVIRVRRVNLAIPDLIWNLPPASGGQNAFSLPTSISSSLWEKACPELDSGTKVRETKWRLIRNYV